MPNFETLLYESSDKIARITFNRPEKLNAINLQMIDEIVQAVDLAEKDDDVNVVIFRGAGRAFSAGFDLTQVFFMYGGGTGKPGEKRPSQRSRLHRDRITLDMLRRILYCWKPTIAQVHGYCIGGGLYITQACDIVIVAEDVQLGHPEQRLAFAGATFMLVKELVQVGPHRAREMLLTGKLINGHEAERFGYANRALPADRLEAEVEELARGIALMPRDAIAVGKAQTFLAFDTLGFGANMTQAVIGHTLATNIRFEDDEFNFLRERREKGTKTAFHERDSLWASHGL